jgi:hypothetical protein
MAAQNARHRRARIEDQVDLPRPGEHHEEAHGGRVAAPIYSSPRCPQST